MVPCRHLPEHDTGVSVNIVACCMACNGLFNCDPAASEVPSTLEVFLEVRDALYLARRARIPERREQECAWFEAHIAPGVAPKRSGRHGIP